MIFQEWYISRNWLIFITFRLDFDHVTAVSRRVWRYQRGNQNPYIEEEQTTQWPKKKYKRTSLQRSTKHPYKTKDRVTRIPLKTGCELRCCVSCSLEHTIRKFNVSVNDSIIKRYSLVGKVFLQSKFKSFCCIVTILAISFKSSAWRKWSLCI